MRTLDVRVSGIGAWSPAQTDWPRLREWLRGQGGESVPAARPAATVLPQAERRRAPATVLLACEVAAQACAAADRDAASLPCVFASSFGEVAISDEMCATLARAPRELSPTRFHNSVHNAPVGYWTQAVHCHASSNALSAWHGTLAAGLLEAAALAHADATPVLLVVYDVAANGPLANLLGADASLAFALVLEPAAEAQGACLRLRHAGNDDDASTQTGIDLLHALALPRRAHLQLAAGDGRVLEVEVVP